jgi:small subunit ribosomal protein S10
MIQIKFFIYDKIALKALETLISKKKSTTLFIISKVNLPTSKKIFTLLKSPHVNKKAKEHFVLFTYKRLLMLNVNSQILEFLKKIPNNIAYKIVYLKKTS